MTKSASTWDLIVAYEMNIIENGANLAAHFPTCPDASLLWSILSMGNDDGTRIS